VDPREHCVIPARRDVVPGSDGPFAVRATRSGGSADPAVSDRSTGAQEARKHSRKEHS
jgi:hypothetical protein